MSLRIALRVVGLLLGGYLLLGALLAMGPFAWAVFVPLLAIGTVQVYRNRRQRSGTDGPPDYCPNCGAAVDCDAFAERTDDRWEVRYCSNCGAPLESETEAGAETDRAADAADPEPGVDGHAKTCSDCGAPTDPDQETCNYCDADL